MTLPICKGWMKLTWDQYLHLTDVVNKLKRKREQLVVGVGSKQTVVHHLGRRRRIERTSRRETGNREVMKVSLRERQW